MIVRSESPQDRAAVRQIHIDAFPTSAEADLVDGLRADGDAEISLVAVEEPEVLGHVMLSRMTAPFRALGLGPVAVSADRRRRGVAARLIEESIARACDGGWQAIFVLGDPAYYKRFGFSAAAAAPFESPYAGPYLMGLALQEGGLPVRSGRIDYARAFSALS
jgi:putative acetyltransferase